MRLWSLFLHLLGFQLLGFSLQAAYTGSVPMPVDAYGASGAHGIRTQILANPADATAPVYVFSPADAAGPCPTWFFAHGYGAGNPQMYNAFITHLVSQGNTVVYADYPEMGGPEALYAIMDSGFITAASSCAAVIDTRRVIFAGHSYGGGATPWLALKAFNERGWGGLGRGLWIMAPWYSHKMTDADLAAFPAGVKLAMQVYQDDVTNDHRMAIDVFRRMNIKTADKAFLVVNSDYLEGYYFHASHVTPNNDITSASGTQAPYDALDAWGVERLSSMFKAAVLDADPTAAEVLFHGGAEHAIQQGRTQAGLSMRPVQVMANPVPLYPSSRYKWGYYSLANPRRDSFPPDTSLAPAHLENISARALSGTQDATLIVGATLAGTQPKTLVLRSVGPSLHAYGVARPVEDPTLRVFQGGVMQFEQDNWGSQDEETLTEAMSEAGAFPLAQGSADAAAELVFLPGTLTAHTGLKPGAASGVSLIELYDGDLGRDTLISNLSARGQVGVGEDVLNAGWVVGGTGSVRVLIRAVGPKLKDYGVSGFLADPKIEVYSQSKKLVENDNWSDESSNAKAVAEAGAMVGAFSLGQGSGDAALVLTLAPGVYTAVISGVNQTQGAALFELYVIP